MDFYQMDETVIGKELWSLTNLSKADGTVMVAWPSSSCISSNQAFSYISKQTATGKLLKDNSKDSHRRWQRLVGHRVHQVVKQVRTCDLPENVHHLRMKCAPPPCLAVEREGEDDWAAELVRSLPRLECRSCGPCGKPNRGLAHILYTLSLCLMTASWWNTCTNDALGFLSLKHTLSLLRCKQFGLVFDNTLSRLFGKNLGWPCNNPEEGNRQCHEVI